MNVDPALEKMDCSSYDSSHMASPKDTTVRGKRVKDRKQTLLNAFMCQELCLAFGTDDKLFHLCPPFSALTKAQRDR